MSLCVIGVRGSAAGWTAGPIRSGPGGRWWQDPAFTLRGPTAVPGCGDFCFVWGGTHDALHEALNRAGATVEVGPVERVGGHDGGRARGASIYTRDPDGNLLEFIRYGAQQSHVIG